MIEFLVGFAFYLTFFAASAGMGTVLQMVALALTAAAAVYALVMRRFTPSPLSAAEVVMYVLGINYVFLGVFGEENAVFLSMAFSRQSSPSRSSADRFRSRHCSTSARASRLPGWQRSSSPNPKRGACSPSRADSTDVCA